MGCGSSSPSSTKINHDLQSSTSVERTEQTIHHESSKTNDQFSLNDLTVPTYVSPVQRGSTICSNGQILILQRGSSTLEFSILPKLLQKTRIPWRHGFIQDIIWCSDLNIFLLLTKDALFSIDPQSLFISQPPTKRPIRKLPTKIYQKIKPYAENKTFWRCTCAGTKLYICYAGHGTEIDEYSLGTSSSKLVNRWLPPKTCAAHEAIWSLRHQPDTNQLGFVILDSKTNQCRLEIRSPQKLTQLWQTVLPLESSECELLPLSNGEWLVINSRGTRLVQIADQKLKATIEYERIVKNAILINDLYFTVRTNCTIDVYRVK